LKHLVLAAGECLTTDEQRILKFADWMGVQTKTISIEQEFALAPQSPPEADGQRGCLVISADTLAQAHKVSPQRLAHLFEERCATLLIFCCFDPTRHSSVLSWLTRGVVRGLSLSADGQAVFDLPHSGRELSRQLSGLSFSAERNLSVPTFDLAGDSRSAEAIMLVNGEPMFIRMPTTQCEMFLLAGSDLPDLEEPLFQESGIEAHYDRLIPLLMFLYHSFGKTCWHGPASTARFIIDDPLLRERYGFLDYRSLLASMQRQGYGTSIAFIPWNYRRTSRRSASILFDRRPNLSICVHGCDHTNKEFEAADQAVLERKAGLALDRMERHQTRTGLAFEPVMVFPQGLFSSDAMLALRAANYLAAVNSTCVPTNARPGALKIADCLRPAISKFHGFPVFQRRYPRRLVDSAFDMFLGKPVLLVEHHSYFRDECEQLEEFVIGLRNLEPKLTWPTLASQLMGSCIMRSVARDSVEVQFFTRRFRLENTEGDQRRFRLAKPEPDPSAIQAVFVDGISVPFSLTGDSVQLELEADPGQVRCVEVVDHPRPPQAARRMGVIYNVGVFARRGLSEFRDNTLARHPRLLQAATELAKGLKLGEE